MQRSFARRAELLLNLNFLSCHYSGTTSINSACSTCGDLHRRDLRPNRYPGADGRVDRQQRDRPGGEKGRPLPHVAAETAASPQQLTLISGSGCIPATHFGKDDRLQVSSLCDHILVLIFGGYNLSEKTTHLVSGCAAWVRVGRRTRQKARR